jgi:HEAT repeats
MRMENVKELVAKYNEGLADPAEIKMLEQLIESGEVELTQLRELNQLDEQLIKSEVNGPSLRTDDAFYSMLADEKRKARKNLFNISLPDWNVLLPRLAFATVLIVAGFAGGYFLQQPASSGTEVKQLTQEVSDLKEMMMLSLLEKESASERLRAVSLTNDMNQVSAKVTSALFQTLNSDENVNVRLAALEALKPYVRDGNVRKNLVISIGKQDSPLVQLELAQLMVELQEKKSVKELKKLLESDRTPAEVKTKIKESIEVLI